MPKPYGIINIFESEAIGLKIQRHLKILVEEKKIPFPIEIFNNPSQSEVETIKSNHSCLFFFEPGENLDHDHWLIQQTHISPLFFKGHQMVLMGTTNYDYLELAKKFNIGNILMNDKFDEYTLAAVIKKLLGDHFFGFYPFFPNGYTSFKSKYFFSGHLHQVFNPVTSFKDFTQHLPADKVLLFQSFVSEMMVNAISYAVYGITPDERDLENKTPPLFPYIPIQKQIEFRIVQDDEKFGVGIRDKSGSLSLKRILSKIQRHSVFGDELLPQGIEDFAGRGLFILSRNNRLVINILKGVQTEILIMHFNSQELNKYQALIINEKDPMEF